MKTSDPSPLAASSILAAESAPDVRSTTDATPAACVRPEQDMAHCGACSHFLPDTINPTQRGYDDMTIKTCPQCNLPHASKTATCPRCRVLSAWHQPSPLAKELMAQMDVIQSALDKAERNAWAAKENPPLTNSQHP